LDAEGLARLPHPALAPARRGSRLPQSNPEAMKESTGGEYRRDLQALRGVAIALVLLYHLGLPGLQAGYLGVDIFFTISGFLITRIIIRSLDAGDFSFAAFYFRRAKRLLPAAYLAFAATIAAAPFFLSGQELHALVAQVAGSVSFTGNIALWLQSGYFDGRADVKPLLHVWSLSLEEQYYMLLPAALFCLPRRFATPAITVGTLASLLLCLYFAPLKPGASFYLLPTRAWELGVGSIGVLALTGRFPAAWKLLAIPCSLALLVIPFFPVGSVHPGLDAVFVCFATLVVILGRIAWWNESAISGLLARLGDISYSLYLVHWPLIAFAHNAFVIPIPASVRVFLGVASIALGYALYRFVERPCRRAVVPASTSVVFAAIVVSAGLVVSAVAVARPNANERAIADARRENPGLDDRCEFVNSFEFVPECRTSDAPRMIIVGDSLAKHIVPGIVASYPGGVVQATKSRCGPVVGVAAFGNGMFGREWAEDCLSFLDSTMEFVSKSRSVETEVPADPVGNFLYRATGPQRPRLLVRSGDGLTESEPSADIAASKLEATIRSLRAMGKKVVIVAPPPGTGMDIGGCLEREATGKIVFGAQPGCELPVAQVRDKRVAENAFLARVSREANVEVVSFDGLLCDNRSCKTRMDNTFLYRDEIHFSIEGSKLIAKKMNLGRRLEELAR